MTTYTPAQLLPYIQRYFPGEDPGKLLHLINGESGGRTHAVGDGGSSIGLFQSQHSPGETIDSQFADAKRLYDRDRANGGTGFGDWGEGRLYQGKPFGALGNHPYGSTGGSMTTPTNPNADAYANGLYAQEKDYAAKLAALLGMPRPTDFAGGSAYDDQIAQYGDLLAKVRTSIAQLKQAPDAAQQQFNNGIASGNLAVNQGQLDVSIAQQAINRALSGQAEAGRRASLIQDAQDSLIKYGLPEGKTAFSDDELGGAFSTFGKILGRDPGQQNKLALGQIAINPEADLAKFDAQLGVTGAIPGGYTPAPPPVGGTGPALPPPPMPSPGGYSRTPDAPATPNPSTGYPTPGGAFSGLNDRPTDRYSLPPGPLSGYFPQTQAMQAPPPVGPLADIIQGARDMPHGGVSLPPWVPDYSSVARRIRSLTPAF